MIRWVLALVILCGSALAQDLPALFSVTGVAGDDVLNIRAEPDPGSAIVGEYAPDQAGVEIVAMSDDRKWGQVSVGEGAGWVTMRYLAAAPTGDYNLAERLICVGTEPFWSLRIAQGRAAQFDTPDGQTQFLPAGELHPATGRTHRFLLHLGDGFSAILRRAQCSDGMSDQVFGVDVDLMTGDGQLLTGCCRLLP